MPVYSMTGYACASPAPRTVDGAAAPAAAGLGLEIRSVNSRFLDLSLRLSDELRSAEPALRELLQARLKRGKVELRAWLEGSAVAARNPSAVELQRLLALQNQIQTWLPQARELSVFEALQHLAPSSASTPDAHATLLALAPQVLDDFCAARAREGARLAAALLERVQQLQALALQAQPLVPALAEQQRLRFLERWNAALGLADGAAAGAATAAASASAYERALAEAAAYALRIDVAEEITRLQAHLSEVAQALERGGAVGKRLDFLMQELQREANTLGSKASSLELTRLALEMKVLIEQMREQVQNLE